MAGRKNRRGWGHIRQNEAVVSQLDAYRDSLKPV